MALSPPPVPPIFQKVDDTSAPFGVLSQEAEVRGGVTEYREIVENNPAYLYCDTNAVPPPELTWYREDQPLSATDGVSVLQGRPAARRRRGVCGQGPGSCSHQSWTLNCLSPSPLSSRGAVGRVTSGRACEPLDLRCLLEAGLDVLWASGPAMS